MIESIPSDRIQEHLRQMTPQVRSRLLAEMERLELCGESIPNSALILSTLRAEFRKTGTSHYRVGNPSRHFFMPLEPALVNRAPEHANCGQIARGSLSAIWDWVVQRLLPTMAKEYINQMNHAIAGENLDQARKIAAAFQTKVAKYLESMLASPTGAAEIREGLAIFTSSHAAFDDVSKMLVVLRARDALAELSTALPVKITEFDGESLTRVLRLLNAFRAKQPDALPFALMVVAKRLAVHWQLIRLAAKVAGSNDVAEMAATPYSVTVTMVLDDIEDKRSLLGHALKNDNVLIAKDLLQHIYATEDALRYHIDGLDNSDWGRRLQEMTAAVDLALQAEVQRLPDKLRHVLGPSHFRRHSPTGRLAWAARETWKTLAGALRTAES